jgi:hypothetical protein
LKLKLNSEEFGMVELIGKLKLKLKFRRLKLEIKVKI